MLMNSTSEGAPSIGPVPRAVLGTKRLASGILAVSLPLLQRRGLILELQLLGQAARPLKALSHFASIAVKSVLCGSVMAIVASSCSMVGC